MTALTMGSSGAAEAAAAMSDEDSGLLPVFALLTPVMEHCYIRSEGRVSACREKKRETEVHSTSTSLKCTHS